MNLFDLPLVIQNKIEEYLFNTYIIEIKKKYMNHFLNGYLHHRLDYFIVSTYSNKIIFITENGWCNVIEIIRFMNNMNNYQINSIEKSHMKLNYILT